MSNAVENRLYKNTALIEISDDETVQTPQPKKKSKKRPKEFHNLLLEGIENKKRKNDENENIDVDLTEEFHPKKDKAITYIELKVRDDPTDFTVVSSYFCHNAGSGKKLSYLRKKISSKLKKRQKSEGKSSVDFDLYIHGRLLNDEELIKDIKDQYGNLPISVKLRKPEVEEVEDELTENGPFQIG